MRAPISVGRFALRQQEFVTVRLGRLGRLGTSTLLDLPHRIRVQAGQWSRLFLAQELAMSLFGVEVFLYTRTVGQQKEDR